ncbi:hypothetical protein FOLKNPGA_01342 [Legionella sp. PC1000]|uniref:hypothetical protein n=1 Tax=Legionella sp. PC1000 TaxID=2746060 RepID=UPI0015F911CD|nr:hypothetical protein [Legionella sp. PC1000]QLZ68563.1 hypothetical protein FOLKNPGA_01342 [Legionella sp. PC1000]
MPQTPPGSPKVEKKVEEEKNLESSQESSFEESFEEDSEQSVEENAEQYSEEETPESNHPQQNEQPRNPNTLFGFTPRIQRIAIFVCPHGHVHMVPAELMPLLSLVSMMNALGISLDEENELEESVGQEAQPEAKKPEGTTEQHDEVSEAKNPKEDGSDEENEEERGYSYFI